jgi:hypothetical protein
MRIPINRIEVAKMASPKKPFGGKKAAPFVKGGGRDKSHPKTAKGTPRKK